MKLVRVKILQN